MAFPVPVPDSEAVPRPAGSAGQRGASGAGRADPDSGAILGSRPISESDQANVRDWRGGAGGHRMGGLDGRRRGHHSQGSGIGRDRLFGAYRLVTTHAAGDGRNRLFPPGALRELPRGGRWHFEAGSGPHAGLHPQGRGVDDSTFQAAGGNASGQSDAPDSAQRCAVECTGVFPAETQSQQCQRTRKCSRFRGCRSVGVPGEPVRVLPYGEWLRDEAGSAAQRIGSTPQPQLGGRTFCQAGGAFPGYHHAALFAFAERYGESDQLPVLAAGDWRQPVASQNASAEWIPSDCSTVAIFLSAILWIWETRLSFTPIISPISLDRKST